MIDLDRPAQPGPSPQGRRRSARRRLLLTVLVVVGSLLAGVVLGGVAMDVWRYRPLAASVAAGKSVVSVLLFAEPAVTAVRREQRRVRIETQVTVVNAGPEMVSVLTVRVDRPDVTVLSLERERQIAPGTTLPVDVVVEWECGGEPADALAASVKVETVDEQVRIPPVSLSVTPWLRSRRAGCAG